MQLSPGVRHAQAWQAGYSQFSWAGAAIRLRLVNSCRYSFQSPFDFVDDFCPTTVDMVSVWHPRPLGIKQESRYKIRRRFRVVLSAKFNFKCVWLMSKKKKWKKIKKNTESRIWVSSFVSRRPCHWLFTIYYWLFDFFSVASVASVADRRTASIGDYFGILLDEQQVGSYNS